jgi:lambda repressor-like predicted transcriptional regulator
MTPFEIKVILLKKGISMRSIARELDVSVNAVSLIINKKMVSKRVMAKIADVIDSDKRVVFPEYFEKMDQASNS